jgi:hypothetical protein
MSHAALESLIRAGYTDREATFVYMVAVHSGYFLRRQFIESVQRERGGDCHAAFCRTQPRNSATSTELPCAEGRIIYHLANGKQVYRMIGWECRLAGPPHQIDAARSVRRSDCASTTFMSHLSRSAIHRV